MLFTALMPNFIDPRNVASAALLTACVLLAASCSDSDPAPDESKRTQLPMDLIGTFHLTGSVGDANPTSLLLSADGTFRWGVSGCDYFGGDVGRWSRDGAEIVLLPSEGRERFLWSGKFATGPVERVTIEANETGLRAHSTSSAGDAVNQQWDEGGVCPDCNEGATPVACGDPYLADEPAL